jgi:NAD(P)-dependent dehydrogenase (short-subunit alcohol dehydrogenase family)
VGAGPGLGLAVARRFGRGGFPVVLIARNLERLATLCAELTAEGIPAASFQADCVDEAQVRAALAAASERFGHVGALVYNAARLGLHLGPLELTAAAFHRALQVDVVSALISVQCVAEQMRARCRGTILLTGGSAAFEPDPDWCALGVGKAGLRNLAFSLAAALEPDGIHVATVTISDWIGGSPEYAADRLASLYWALHTEEPGSWRREVIV